MISNLFIFITYYLLITISVIGYGLFFFSLSNNNKISSNYGYTGLTGLLLLCIYSYLSSFFYPHNTSHNLIILIVGLICFFYFNKKSLNKDIIIISTLLIIYFSGMLIFKTHDDFPYYHFKYSFYLTQMPSIIGLGNFNLGLRTQSSIFYLNSLFYLPFVKYFMFQITIFLIFLFANIILISKILKTNFRKKINFLTFYYLLSFIFINIFFYRFSEHGTDRSAQILIFILIGEILHFTNFKFNETKILSKLFLIIALIISLKAFYILYLIFFSIILYNLIDVNNFKKIIFKFFTNTYLYLFLLLMFSVFTINFINSGCIVYPVSFTCFDNYSWAISKIEVTQLNNWYEQWSKAGATPNFRVENPEIYIKNFNWVSNWIDEYFFTKVSDYILGLIFLLVIVYSVFFPYKKSINKNNNKVVFTLIIIFILLFEWFYNHPSLRYGGYCLIASIAFIFFSLKLENSNQSLKKIKKKIIYLMIFSLIVFSVRNINRISNEVKKYDYKPIENVYFHINNSYFDLDEKIKKLKNDLSNCNNLKKKCNKDERYAVKYLNNFFIFSINDN